ncbi:MAG: hypothetical protein CTY19_05960 [Methylomonas sp.]|nr:MAG: hypothetical protein CTY19_05960 [Methylomonas sp.]
MSSINNILTLIAQKHLSVETLKTEGRDDLDFHALAVWDIRKALEAAFIAGVELGHQTPKATEQDIAGNH